MGFKKRKNTSLPKSIDNVDGINIHFLNSIPNLLPDVDLLGFYRDSENRLNDDDFSFTTVDEMEVLSIIRSIKSKAVGNDGINILTLHLCVPHILPHITHIVNTCIKNSIFPSQWKKALVHPVPKNTNPKGFNDLRPISILPTLSKILEKIMSRQLWVHLTRNSIIPLVQSGYRENHSCVTVLLNITDDIIRATDQDKLTILTLLDYSKAFDSLNHEIFDAVSYHIGLSPGAVLFLRSFLSERLQAVCYGHKLSTFLEVLRGVPQGSILGPVLFIVFISQFTKYLVSCSSHYYADDGQLYLSFYPDEATQAVAALNFDLSIILEISRKHCLHLNATKTVAILFGRSTDRSRFEAVGDSVVMDGVSVGLSPKVNSLGVWIDQDLRFTDHVSACLQKAYGMLRLVYQNREFLNTNLRRLLCDSVVLSHLSYADIVYNPCLSALDKNRVQKLQNSCLQLIFGIRKYERISHTLGVVNWLNMSNRRLLHSAILFMKIVNTRTPPYLYNKITFRSDVHNLNIRFKGTLTPPVFSTELFRRSFSYRVAQVVNSLPVNIRAITNGNRFKISLFRKLFDEKLGLLM